MQFLLYLWLVRSGLTGTNPLMIIFVNCVLILGGCVAKDLGEINSMRPRDYLDKGTGRKHRVGLSSNPVD